MVMPDKGVLPSPPCSSSSQKVLFSLHSNRISLHSNRIQKLRKFEIHCWHAPKTANCKAGRELITHKWVMVLHHELHEGNSHCTTWWVLCHSEAAMIASSPECLRSAGKDSEAFHCSLSCFHILFYTHVSGQSGASNLHSCATTVNIF